MDAIPVYPLPNTYIYHTSGVTRHDTYLKNSHLSSSVDLLSQLSSLPSVYFFAIPMLEQ